MSEQPVTDSAPPGVLRRLLEQRLKAMRDASAIIDSAESGTAIQVGYIALASAARSFLRALPDDFLRVSEGGSPQELVDEPSVMGAGASLSPMPTKAELDTALKAPLPAQAPGMLEQRITELEQQVARSERLLSRFQNGELLGQHGRQQADRIAQLESALAAVGRTPREEPTEQWLRQEWWLNHGHSGQYGDDGEMQCGQCAPIWDYKRTPINELREHVQTLRLERVAAALRAGSGPPAAKEPQGTCNPFCCNVCGAQFCTYEELMQHLQ